MTAERNAILQALRDAGLCDQVVETRSLSGGCIHAVSALTLGDGSSVVAKVNDAVAVSLFQEEAAGLQAMEQTATLLVPRVFAVGVYADRAVLLMSEMKRHRGDDAAWRSFGSELAAMHNAPAGDRYGFDGNNHLGTTLQINDWCDDWVRFNAEHRLGHQLRLLERVLSTEERRRVQRVIDRLDSLIPRTPRPSLLHGDLWSGNALATRDDAGRARIGVIDPACSIGDGWADIAMMKLFGGFPHTCYQAYAQAVEDHWQVESRIGVYQLYHVLNHVTIFGRGYVGQAMGLAASLGA